jgi:hypothetical protein
MLGQEQVGLNAKRKRSVGSGPQEAFGLDGLEVAWNVFHAWKQFQEDGDRAQLTRGTRRL